MTATAAVTYCCSGCPSDLFYSVYEDVTVVVPSASFCRHQRAAASQPSIRRGTANVFAAFCSRWHPFRPQTQLSAGDRERFRSFLFAVAPFPPSNPAFAGEPRTLSRLSVRGGTLSALKPSFLPGTVFN